MTQIILLCFLFISTGLFASEAKSNDKKWLDNLHQGVSSSIYQSANWFDGFFKQEKTLEKAQATAKLRLGYVPAETNLAGLEHRIKLKAKLPNLKNKWDVIFSDHDDTNRDSTADEVISDIENNKDDDLNLAIRFTHSATKKKYITTRLGLGKGADIYLRTRYRRNFQHTDSFQTIIEPSIYYYLRHGWHYRLLFNFEWQCSKDCMWQLNNRWDHESEEDLTTWRHSLLYYYQLNEKAAVVKGIFYTGNIEQGYQLENKGVFIRYRQQALRDWFYYEIEPFIHYPKTREFKQTLGIALRIELNFG
ncbi:hypothetical protein [Catenovulum maritimum]|uniref:Uncharacterized protein n=1 Tax=Catenovulum maritimum TaxID=1513271 RepID=A0A0J8GPF9_9ALTE|nr:hypothetical protein [Catenovulum maritimum]KMT64657.1 hypothetical protein XM47_13545 [Catenovulum maritimum]